MVLAACASGLWACNIPVFRYALENWQPDPYKVLVVSQEVLTEPHRALVERLQLAALKHVRMVNMEVMHRVLSLESKS